MQFKRQILLGLALLAGLTLAAPARAVDRVKLLSGSQQTGDIKESTATEITLEIGATKRQLPVNEIDSIQFEGEPTGLTQARLAIRNGRYAEAVSHLAKVAPAEIKRELIAQDVQFYQALATARLALAGGGSIADAGKRMLGFEKSFPNNLHYYEACEALGDLLMGMGNYPVAETYYAKLAAAPWPQYKMRAAVLTANALTAQKKYDQALARYEQVLSSDASGADASAQRVAATLGKAEALSNSGKADEALKLVDRVIQQAGPDDDQLLARAYNTKGHCLQAAGQTKPAIVAYLHVDLLYPQFAPQHAEALAHLAELFTADNKAQRAAQARGTLKQKYPQSVWASK